MNDKKQDLDVALGWAVSSKNSLASFNGYSPNQLVFGKNPNYPCVLTDKVPALEGQTSSQVVAENLNAMHAARKAYVQNESSEKIRRALRHRIRPSGNVKYENGENVYYRRRNDDHWHGPGTVIGQENQQVLVKHGSRYIRVHPCQLMKERHTYEHDGDDDDTLEIEQKQEKYDLSYDNSEDSESEDPGNVEEVNIDFQAEPVTIEDKGRRVEGEGSNNTDFKIKPGMKMTISVGDDPNETEEVEILSRAGKVGNKNTGKYKDFWNVAKKDGTIECVDMKHSVTKLKETDQPESGEEKKNQVTEPEFEEVKGDRVTEEVLLVNNSEESLIVKAKHAELDNWTRNNVYEEVPFTNQKLISSRWVITKKGDENGQMRFKARLVARGFEEKTDIQADSPTCTKEALRIMFAIMSANHWPCHSIDIKAAFLQGKPIEREIFLNPPPEVKQDGVVWKLNTCVYGLNDASRKWYFKVHEELSKLGVQVCKYDAGLFYWHNNGKLEGIISTHVDDFCWGGTSQFEQHVIDKIRKIFRISVEHSKAFKYLGINMISLDNEIRLSQTTYLNSIYEIELTTERIKNKRDTLTDAEKTMMRQLIGQLNWLATQTRPDLLYECCYFMSLVNKATVADIIQLNKVVRKAKKEEIVLRIPNIGRLEDAKIICYSDASFGTLNDGGSQGGYVIFLSNSDSSVVIPIAWQSRRVRRVVKSTLAAETLALVDAAETSFWICCILQDLIRSVTTIPIDCRTDCQSLVDASHSSKPILDKRLRVDISIIREMLQKKEIEKLLWLTTKEQLADCLTKTGAATSQLLQVFAEARL